MVSKLQRTTGSLAPSPPPSGGFLPPQVTSLEDTGLNPLWLQDLVLKVLYFRGYLSGFKIASEIQHLQNQVL